MEEKEIEIWRWIEDENYTHKASTLGRIKSFIDDKENGVIIEPEVYRKNDGNMISKHKLKNGSSERSGIRISNTENFITMAFLGFKFVYPRMLVEHIDENPLNNRIENLRVIIHPDFRNYQDED